MNYPIYNNSNLDLAPVQHLFDSFLPFAEKYLGISKCPDINLVSDQENAQLPLGKTGFYDPSGHKITIFTDNRHIKDILRSLSHELVHHKQNLQGMFDGGGFTGPGYAQKDQHLRSMEREAYEKGNLCLRDWEDKHKKQLQESIYTTKGDNSKMSYKNWRNQEVNDRLMESWGFKTPETEILTEGVVDMAKGAVKGASKVAGKVAGGAAGGLAGLATLNPVGVAAGALAGQKLGGMAAEKAADLVVNEDGEELEEMSIPGSAAARMDAEIAAMEREDLLALQRKVEDYLMSAPPAEGPPSRSHSPVPRRLEPARSPYSVRFEEEKVRGAVREAITKALKNRKA